MTRHVEIETIRHKGLRRYFETGNAKGLVGDVDRIRKMLVFIDAAASLDELAAPPNFMPLCVRTPFAPLSTCFTRASSNTAEYT